MLNAIVKWLIAQRWLVVIASIMITLWGLRVLTQMPLYVFPSFAPPQVEIQIESIEQLGESAITALNGVPVLLEQVADVKIGAELKRGDAYLDGKKAVVVVVNKQPQKAVFEGSIERLAAILMTALTSALGMLPVIIKTGAGQEILQPLGVVVLGGLFTFTALTLLVLPALYALFARFLIPQKRQEIIKNTINLEAKIEESKVA